MLGFTQATTEHSDPIKELFRDLLDLFKELGRSLITTNCVENLNERVDGYAGNVKRWHHSPQRRRWMALALLEDESGMCQFTGYKDLPKLKRALKEAIPDRE